MSEQNEQGMDEVARLRSAAMADVTGTKALVHHNGHAFEVRAPSPAQAEAIKRRCTEVVKGETQRERHNQNKHAVLLVLTCTYAPGTDKRVFNDRDLDTYMNRPLSNLFRALFKAINNLDEVDKEEAAGKSEVPESSSSTD